MNTIHSDKRKSGISLIGDLLWGTHFCQFYDTKEDMLDIFLPYFRAGLESNEFCLWVTSGLLGEEGARMALKKAIPHFEKFEKKGQMEIMPLSRWQGRGEKSGKSIVSRLDQAISEGFDGLRLACDVFPEKKGGTVFTSYNVAEVVSRFNMIAVFAYPRDEFDAIGLMEVVKHHRFALVRNAGRWEVIESSEARITKDALRRSEEKLRSLFSYMAEGFAYHRIVLDARGKPCDYIFLEVNEAFERLTGLKGENIIGKRVTEVLPDIEKDPTDWIGKYGKVAITGMPVRFESHAELLDKWFSVSAFSPHMGYFAVTFSDITERKHAEEVLRRRTSELRQLTETLEQQVQERTTELAKANEELKSEIAERRCMEEERRKASLYARSLIEASLDPLVTISVAGKIMDVNKATELVTGIPRDQLIGSDFSEYFTDPQKAREGYQEVFSKGSVRDYPLTIRHTSGQITEVLYNASVYRNEAGEPQGVFAAARDITEQKRAEAKLRTYMAKLEISNRELQDFAFVASHDLQEPLRKIQSFGQRLKTKYGNALGVEGLDYLERMSRGAKRMQDLIQALLRYSRVTTKPDPFIFTDLNCLLKEVLGDLEISLSEADACVEAELLPTIEADPNQMRQLFQNLISNSLKFRRTKKPVIKLYARLPDHHDPKKKLPENPQCEIFVEDNGIGFEEKYLDRIFTPFQRLHGREAYEGTGMGLAICRKIVERHGGSITAKSEQEKGSTFIITLPVKQPGGDDL